MRPRRIDPRRVFAGLLAVLSLGLASLPTEALARDAETALKKLDRDGDGRVSRQQWRKSGELFAGIDANGDGELTLTEFAARFSREAATPPAPITPPNVLDAPTAAATASPRLAAPPTPA